MKFSVRFKIVNRFGKASAYSLRDICITLVDQYSLREHEITAIVGLRAGSNDTFVNGDMAVRKEKEA